MKSPILMAMIIGAAVCLSPVSNGAGKEKEITIRETETVRSILVRSSGKIVEVV